MEVPPAPPAARSGARHNSRIARPKVLLVVAHPAIGAALETLLRIEDRYEVRRVPSLAQLRTLPEGWRADAALVDGLLLGEGTMARLGAPTLVLSGNAADGQALGRRVEDPRGWLRKESSVEDLVSAIDGLLGRPASAVRPGRSEVLRMVLLFGTACVLGGAILYLVWLAVFR